MTRPCAPTRELPSSAAACARSTAAAATAAASRLAGAVALSHAGPRALSAAPGVQGSPLVQVCNQTPPIGEKPSLMTFRVRLAWTRRSALALCAAPSCPPAPQRRQRAPCGDASAPIVPCRRRALAAPRPPAPAAGPSQVQAALPYLALYPKPIPYRAQEVETLFHEFGHALQHMLTEQADGLVAGIRGIEWDAVELPSQFMEGWCARHPISYPDLQICSTSAVCLDGAGLRACCAWRPRASTGLPPVLSLRDWGAPSLWVLTGRARQVLCSVVCRWPQAVSWTLLECSLLACMTGASCACTAGAMTAPRSTCLPGTTRRASRCQTTCSRSSPLRGTSGAPRMLQQQFRQTWRRNAAYLLRCWAVAHCCAKDAGPNALLL
jgi:hypothetical protein